MWVRFIADHCFTPTEDRRVSILYKRGWIGSVRKQCADEAIALKRAVRTSAPRRKAAA